MFQRLKKPGVRAEALLTNRLFSTAPPYCMYNLGVGGEVVKVVILILGVSSEGLEGS